MYHFMINNQKILHAGQVEDGKSSMKSNNVDNIFLKKLGLRRLELKSMHSHNKTFGI